MHHQARLEEMQAQYDKLLGEVESVKQQARDQARDEVFKTFDDNREHVPGGTPAGSPRPGAKAESPRPGAKAESPRPGAKAES